MARVKHTAKGNDSDSSQKKKTLKTTKSKKSKLSSESQTKQKTVIRDSRHQTSILNYTGTKGRDSKNNNKQDNESMQNSKSTFINKSIGVDKNRKSEAAGGRDVSSEKMKRKLALQKSAQYSPEG